MTNKRPIDEIYADILGDNATPEMKHLAEELETLYSAPDSPAYLSASIRQAARERHTSRDHQATQTRQLDSTRWSPHRFPIAAAVLVTTVALVASAYAFGPTLIDRVFNDRGAQQIADEQLNEPVGLSETINGFTVTIQSAYADSNRVLVEYSIAGPSDRTFNSMHFLDYELTDEHGTQLPFGGGRGHPVENGTKEHLVWFDTSNITEYPSEITLHLRLSSLEVAERVDGSVRLLAVDGWVEFDFTVPFYPGRVAELQQSVEAEGISVTLQRVVVTPSETRVYVSGITSEHRARLQIDGQEYRADPRMQVYDSVTGELVEEDVTVFTFREPLYETQSEWTLTILPLPGDEGAWTFDFVVPDPADQR